MRCVGRAWLAVFRPSIALVPVGRSVDRGEEFGRVPYEARAVSVQGDRSEDEFVPFRDVVVASRACLFGGGKFVGGPSSVGNLFGG
jgi:hypothetical protein